MKLFFALVLFLGIQLIRSETAAPKKKEIKVDNRVICMKGKKGAKLNEIQYVGVTKTSVDLQTFFKQFTPRHVIPKDSGKKATWVSPKFITGTLNAIARRECSKQFEKDNKLAKDEVWGILFPNGKQLLSLFHDSDFKWSGAPTQLKWNWPELSNYEGVV